MASTPYDIDSQFMEANKAILKIQSLNDEDFVTYVRQVYEQAPDWLTLVCWETAVRRELDMRLLLKKVL